MNNVRLLYIIHGLLQVIAFVVLYPIGALIALFRNSIGPLWLPVHVTIQLLATFCVFLALGIMIYAKSVVKNNDSSRFSRKHEILGFTLIFCIILQLIWAVFMRAHVPWTVWFNVHLALATFIIVGGYVNVFLGVQNYKLL